MQTVHNTGLRQVCTHTHTHQTLPWANHDIIGADVITNPPVWHCYCCYRSGQEKHFSGLSFPSDISISIVFSLRRYDMCDQWTDWWIISKEIIIGTEWGGEADHLRKSLFNRELADVPKRAGEETKTGLVMTFHISLRQAVDKCQHAVNSLQINCCKSAS